MSVPMTIYQSGALVTTSAAFVNEAGAPADPTTVVFKYKLDAAATVSVTFPSSPIVKDSTGNYHADMLAGPFAGPGFQQVFVEWVGTGAVVGIQFDAWKVEPALL